MFDRMEVGRPLMVWLLVWGGTIINKTLAQDSTESMISTRETPDHVLIAEGLQSTKVPSTFTVHHSTKIPQDRNLEYSSDVHTTSHTESTANGDGLINNHSGTRSESKPITQKTRLVEITESNNHEMSTESSIEKVTLEKSTNKMDISESQTLKHTKNSETTDAVRVLNQRINDKESTIPQGYNVTSKENTLPGKLSKQSNISRVVENVTLLPLKTVSEEKRILSSSTSPSSSETKTVVTDSAYSETTSTSSEAKSANLNASKLGNFSLNSHKDEKENLDIDLSTVSAVPSSTNKIHLDKEHPITEANSITSTFLKEESVASGSFSNIHSTTVLEVVNDTGERNYSVQFKTTENSDVVTNTSLATTEDEMKFSVSKTPKETSSVEEEESIDLDAGESIDTAFKEVEYVLRSDKDRKFSTGTTIGEFSYVPADEFANDYDHSKSTYSEESEYEERSTNAESNSEISGGNGSDSKTLSGSRKEKVQEGGVKNHTSVISNETRTLLQTRGLGETTTELVTKSAPLGTSKGPTPPITKPYFSSKSKNNDTSVPTLSEIQDYTVLYSEVYDTTSAVSESTEYAATLPELEINATRIPKRIQGSQPANSDTTRRIRPARPDPEYFYGPDSDFYQSRQPSVPSYHRSQRPGSESYTPSRQDPDSSRPQHDPYRPSVEGSDYFRQSSPDSLSGRPQRPQNAFSRPYRPQGTFARPYRPDRDQTRPVSSPDYYNKPTDNLSPSSKFDMDYPSAFQPGIEYGASTRGDSKSSSEADGSSYERPPLSDTSRPYRPSIGSRQPFLPVDDLGDFPGSARTPYTPAIPPRPSDFSSRPGDVSSEEGRRIFPTKPDKIIEDVPKQPGAVYPRPGFGSNYGSTVITSPRPFNVGTPTSTKNLTKVEFIKADCFDNYMKVSIRFNGSFSGLIYSSGYSQDYSCSYVNGTGRYHYEFIIKLNKCGTLGQQEVTEKLLPSVTRRRQERAQYLVNSVTVQYNSLIEEDNDEHFRVTCEYGSDFWRTVTFPVVSVETSAMKVRTGSPVVFTLAPPQCSMEIRSGYGHTGSRVSGPVNVGDPLTLVIHMKSETSGFDISVSNCFAHNGAQKKLQLIDSNGCAVQSKLASPFRGANIPDRPQQITLYSYLKAFRFTGSPALYIECDVHMCHGSCPSQHCYWRNLQKRSVTLEKAVLPEDAVISESISLFQALEVRHEEFDSPNSLAMRTQDGHFEEDLFCLRTAGFSAILASLTLLLLITSLTSVCLCARIRRMKAYMEFPDTKNFIKFEDRAK